MNKYDSCCCPLTRVESSKDAARQMQVSEDGVGAR
jgi:hypothetical protein